MKIKLLLLYVYTISINTFSQINFQEHVVTTSINSPRSVYTVDINGDGDLDLLFNGSNKLVWSENLDGQGNYDLPQIISTSFNGSNYIYPEDIDNDGDIDVISAEWGEAGIVAWYENTDGLGNFDPKQIITTDIDYARSVYAADLDSDGDLDVISASNHPDKLAWYENLDGLGDFGAQNIISTTQNTPTIINAVDLDNDGDVDVICSSWYDGWIAWYENIDGLGNFGTHQFITGGQIGVENTMAIDIDNDNDYDILSSSYEFYGKVVWCENIDSSGTFGPAQIITTSANRPQVTAADLDNDGDVDVLSAGNTHDKIAWYENLDGLGDFGVQQKISGTADNGDYFLTTSDVNIDGKVDVLFASRTDDKIAWYENLATLSLAEETASSLLIHPNPTSNILYIQSKIKISKIEVLNSIGQVVLFNQNKNEINMTDLSQNIYICKITDIQGNLELRKIIKK